MTKSINNRYVGKILMYLCEDNYRNASSIACRVSRSTSGPLTMMAYGLIEPIARIFYPMFENNHNRDTHVEGLCDVWDSMQSDNSEPITFVRVGLGFDIPDSRAAEGIDDVDEYDEWEADAYQSWL